MSLSRLSGRTIFFPVLASFSRNCTGAIGESYNFVGISHASYRQSFGINNVSCRPSLNCLLPRYEVRRLLFSKCSGVSPFGNQNIGRPYSVLNSRRSYATHATTERKSQKTLMYLTGLVFAMVGLSYAAVPLYRRFCQATGYGGTVQRRETVEEKIARHAKDGTVTTREIVVQFNADVADGMPWKFVPTQREVRVKPGESALAFYTAENRSSTPITGVSTYNVTPMKAAVYFNKIQCFCFEEQRLLPGEQIDMPVFFYIDPEFETDPRIDGINNLILSYTFFKVPDE
ncbi:cytochrome c oxidase assembly protein COX11, mitochondrial [Coffea arabica]|uniref:Cytochrome c oxidase assembly protein COX11, mitochondrial n=1 Tax=Coffea arabica TaxID=13443 RepID=A0A6P6T548_COFAR